MDCNLPTVTIPSQGSTPGKPVFITSIDELHVQAKTGGKNPFKYVEALCLKHLSIDGKSSLLLRDCVAQSRRLKEIDLADSIVTLPYGMALKGVPYFMAPSRLEYLDISGMKVWGLGLEGERKISKECFIASLLDVDNVDKLVLKLERTNLFEEYANQLNGAQETQSEEGRATSEFLQALSNVISLDYIDDLIKEQESQAVIAKRLSRRVIIQLKNDVRQMKQAMRIRSAQQLLDFKARERGRACPFFYYVEELSLPNVVNSEKIMLGILLLQLGNNYEENCRKLREKYEERFQDFFRQIVDSDPADKMRKASAVTFCMNESLDQYNEEKQQLREKYYADIKKINQQCKERLVAIRSAVNECLMTSHRLRHLDLSNSNLNLPDGIVGSRELELVNLAGNRSNDLSKRLLVFLLDNKKLPQLILNVDRTGLVAFKVKSQVYTLRKEINEK